MTGAVLLGAGNGLESVGVKPHRPRVLSWPGQYLAPADRDFLINCGGQDNRRRHGLGIPNKDFYAAMGYGTTSGVRKRRKRLAAQIAMCLNRDRVPFFTLFPANTT